MEICEPGWLQHGLTLLFLIGVVFALFKTNASALAVGQREGIRVGVQLAREFIPVAKREAFDDKVLLHTDPTLHKLMKEYLPDQGHGQ